jgi:zinc D-Ala-D-Ala carboxypeptidase
VDGLLGVSQRVAEIQLRIASLSRMQPPAASNAGRAGLVPAPGTFSAVLADAISNTEAPAATRVNADGVPVELAAYGNGQVPASALAPIGRGSHRLWEHAADGFSRMTEAAARDGVRIGVTDSYRSYDQQVDLARRKGLYSQGGLAAAPGTSDHGWGLSLDLDLDSRALQWMRRNGASFGYVEDVPREPWHWTFKP